MFEYRRILDTITYFFFSIYLILIIFFFSFCTFLSYIFLCYQKQTDSSRKNTYTEFVNTIVLSTVFLALLQSQKKSNFLIDFALEPSKTLLRGIKIMKNKSIYPCQRKTSESFYCFIFFIFFFQYPPLRIIICFGLPLVILNLN